MDQRGDLNFSLAVLAGGRGRRLGGVPKGLLIMPDGQTVTDRLLSLGPHWSFIIANEPQGYERFQVPVVGDMVTGRGAPGGVVTALAFSPTPWVLVAACDMPWLNACLVAALTAAWSEDVDAVCFSRDARLEPLFGLYRSALWRDWATRMVGNPSMQQLLSSVRVRALTAPEPEALRSINTPADIAFASKSQMS